VYSHSQVDVVDLHQTTGLYQRALTFVALWSGVFAAQWSDEGLLTSTGGFTLEARREATRDGAPPIDLINGRLFRIHRRVEKPAAGNPVLMASAWRWS
jgi:hypothetical protein